MTRPIRSLVLMGCLLAATGFAASGKGPHREKKVGVAIGAIADPYPALIGVSLKANVLPFARISAGFGSALASDFSLTSWGAGVDLFHPKWRLSPLAGLHFSSVHSTADFVIRDVTVPASSSLFVVYATFGLDYQSAKGWNLGAGYALPFGTTFSGLGLPYFYAGRFF